MNAVFPCKINPPHLGHIITLLKIKDDYDVIIVDVLDIDLIMSAVESINLIKKVLDFFPNKFEYKTHKVSYALESSGLLKDNVIITGNKKVYKKLKDEGFEVRFIDRTPIFRGEYIREAYLKGRDMEEK